VLFFWTGGAWAAGRKGFRMLGEGMFLGSLGREILRSVNLLNEGPDGIELGSVKTRVTMAKMAIDPSRQAMRRGEVGGIGRPKRLR